MANKTCSALGCDHYAGYLAWEDDIQGEIPMCACCYGEPYDPAECEGQPPKLSASDLDDLALMETTTDVHVDMTMVDVAEEQALGEGRKVYDSHWRMSVSQSTTARDIDHAIEAFLKSIDIEPIASKTEQVMTKPKEEDSGTPQDLSGV